MLDKTKMLEEMNDDIRALFSYLVASMSLFFFPPIEPLSSAPSPSSELEDD